MKYQLEDIQKINSRIIKIVKVIEDGLRKGALPADDAIVFEDYRLYLSSTITTPDILSEELSPPVSLDNIIGIDNTGNDIDTTKLADVSSGLTTGYVDYGIDMFKRNVYISDPEFHYFQSQYPVFDITIQESTSYSDR